jgi:carbonic anhydrase
MNLKTVDIIYRYAAQDVSARLQPSDGEAALLRLNDGNRDFALLLDHINDDTGIIQQIIPVDPHDLGLAPGVTGPTKQRPFAVVLGCSDARVPIELIFNEGPNDLFVVRVAGNGLGMEVLGSIRYAVENLGGTLKLIVVLGHSGCGALTTAVDVFLNPSEYLTIAANHSIRNILDRSLLVVQACARKLLTVHGSDVVHRTGYRQALIEASIVTNAALAAYSIGEEFAASALAELKVAYGVYVIETREVWAPRAGNANGTGLAEVPGDPPGFADLGEAIARSARIASFLKSGA